MRLLIIRVACRSLTIQILHVADLRIGYLLTSGVGHSVVDLGGGEASVALGRSGTLRGPLRLSNLSAYLPLQQHPVHHLLNFVGMLTGRVASCRRTRALLALQT